MRVSMVYCVIRSSSYLQLYLYKRQWYWTCNICCEFFSFVYLFFWSVIQWNLCNSKAVYKVSTCDLNDRMFRDLQTVCRDAIDRLPCWRLKWLYSIAVWVECSKKKSKNKNTQWILDILSSAIPCKSKAPKFQVLFL